jgi:hypothetical protein
MRCGARPKSPQTWSRQVRRNGLQAAGWETGRLDILVNNAGAVRRGNFFGTTLRNGTPASG